MSNKRKVKGFVDPEVLLCANCSKPMENFGKEMVCDCCGEVYRVCEPCYTVISNCEDNLKSGELGGGRGEVPSPLPGEQ